MQRCDWRKHSRALKIAIIAAPNMHGGNESQGKCAPKPQTTPACPVLQRQGSAACCEMNANVGRDQSPVLETEGIDRGGNECCASSGTLFFSAIGRSGR